MKFRAYLLAALLAIVGVSVISRGQAKSSLREQGWLEQNTPAEVGELKAEPGPDGSNVTYRLDQVRDALQAAGLVGRVYRKGAVAYDVVVVYSDRGESFHDPAGCFGAQGWQILSQETRWMESGSGKIPFNSLMVKSAEGVEQPAAYCFGTGSQLYASQTQLLRAMFLQEVLTMRSQEGAMYRFIGLSQGATQEEVLQFAAQYMGSIKGLAGRE